MARIRSLHPGLFTDEAFMGLGPRQRLLLLALGTFCDYADRFVYDEDRLRIACGDVWSAEAFASLVAVGLVTRKDNECEVIFAFGFRRRRISKWEATRSRIFRRDGYTCQYCGSDERLHCDHVMPKSRGGSDSDDNLTTACRSCNLSKHDKTVAEWLQ